MRERQVENDIVSALENGELQLYVQPKVDMRDGRVIGGEALVRWKHPERAGATERVHSRTGEKRIYHQCR